MEAATGVEPVIKVLLTSPTAWSPDRQVGPLSRPFATVLQPKVAAEGGTERQSVTLRGRHGGAALLGLANPQSLRPSRLNGMGSLLPSHNG